MKCFDGLYCILKYFVVHCYSRYSGRETSCVLFNIPDGHTKEMPTGGSKHKVKDVPSAKEVLSSNGLQFILSHIYVLIFVTTKKLIQFFFTILPKGAYKKFPPPCPGYFFGCISASKTVTVETTDFTPEQICGSVCIVLASSDAAR